MIPEIRRILVPIDPSPGTEQTVAYAAVVAKSLGASITLAHIDQVPNAMVAIVPGASAARDLADETLAATARLDALKAEISGVSQIDTLLVTAPAVASTLVELARARGFDLIVMGTHARTGVSRFLIGSIAEEVMRHAHCPVLLVHLPPEK